MSESTLIKSDSIVKIFGAILKFQAEVDAIKKSAKNPFFKSNYADLASIQEEVDPILAKYELGITSIPVGTAALCTLLIHSSGEFIGGTFELPLAKQDPQGGGSAISYMRRYAIQSILNLRMEDDDGNRASGKIGTHMEVKVLGLNVKVSAQEAFQQYLSAIQVAPDIEVLKDVYTEATKKFKGDSDALHDLNEAKDARKKELAVGGK